MMKRIGIMTLVACVALSSVAYAGSHYKLGNDWKVGEFGAYVVVDDAGNRVLCAASVSGGDPKHAWINQDFGSDYTIKADVMMLSWTNDADASRAGIVGRLQPNGTAIDGDHDRGVNLLLHQTYNQVQFLNDLRGWGPAETFTWATRTWYVFTLTFSGNTVSGSIVNKAKPTDMIELAPWEFVHPEERTAGFVGVTASTKIGQVVYYDNFEVTVGGQVVFSDDFEGTAAAPSSVGLSSSWVVGEAGYYVVNGGKLFAIASNAVDPKHIWYGKELVGGGSISADVNMLTWDVAPTHDHSRAGVALHIQPNGTAIDGDHDRGVNLLFHQELTQVQFLNDLRGWGPAETFTWAPETEYPFVLSSDGTTVKGSIGTFNLADWAFVHPEERVDGFAGITASTRAGQVASFDNIVVKNAAGQVVFSDDFETFYGTSSASDWELFQ